MAILLVMAFLLLAMILVAQIVLCYDGTAAAGASARCGDGNGAAGGATSAADFAVADGAQRGSKRKPKAKERPAG